MLTAPAGQQNKPARLPLRQYEHILKAMMCATRRAVGLREPFA
jgi:hypothetical protein